MKQSYNASPSRNTTFGQEVHDLFEVQDRLSVYETAFDAGNVGKVIIGATIFGRMNPNCSNDTLVLHAAAISGRQLEAAVSTYSFKQSEFYEGEILKDPGMQSTYVYELRDHDMDVITAGPDRKHDTFHAYNGTRGIVRHLRERENVLDPSTNGRAHNLLFNALDRNENPFGHIVLDAIAQQIAQYTPAERLRIA